MSMSVMPIEGCVQKNYPHRHFDMQEVLKIKHEKNLCVFSEKKRKKLPRYH